MLGQNQTTNFQIGNAEIRIGTMARANRLTQSDSMGLIQSATVKVSQESVDLEAGLPKTLIDTAIVRSVITVEAQAYEYSRRNILTMTGGSLSNPTLSASAAAGTVATAVGSATNLSSPGSSASINITGIQPADLLNGALVVVSQASDPSQVSVLKLIQDATTYSGGCTITYNPSLTPLLSSLSVGDIAYKANQIGLGGNTQTNYFTLDVLGVDHSTGRPTGFKFWKAAVSGGLEYSFSNDNYAVTPLTFKVLMPSQSDVSGALTTAGINGMVPAHPFGMFFNG